MQCLDRDDVNDGAEHLLDSLGCLFSELVKVSTPYVNHIATMTGGVGYQELSRFYKASASDALRRPSQTDVTQYLFVRENVRLHDFTSYIKDIISHARRLHPPPRS